MTDSDREFMREAIALAERGWGRTSPNPIVGAVVIRNGHIIGRGWHRKAGTPHAEVNAIADCKESPDGGTIYVTLEPCSTFGRTPPCTEAIKNAGLKKVVIGCLDPNPRHAGAGVKILEDAGIEVAAQVEEDSCFKLNEAFFKWVSTGMPFVILKMAMTLDGKIATHSGNSQWITGPVARERVQYLRQWSDAIMVGGETLRQDRPSLTVRGVDNWERQPRRIIVSRSTTPEQAKALMCPGVDPEVIAPENAEAWRQTLKTLGEEGVTAVLVEGGGELAAAVLEAGMVDKVEFHIAPKILGGRDSRPVVGGFNPDTLSEAMNLTGVCVTQLGDDIGISGYPDNSWSK